MTNSLSDEELEAFLRELERAPLPKKQARTLRVQAPPQSEPHSLKISFVILLSLCLFSLVQATFTIPIYTKINRIEELLKREREMPPIFPMMTEDDDEIIEPLDVAPIDAFQHVEASA